MVVDDSTIIRKIMSRYLDCAKANYFMCSDGSEAIAWFNQNMKICCCVITDLEMPKQGGDAVIRHVTSISPTIPCFLVSGNDITLDNLPKGTQRAIVKPITQDQVDEILRELVEIQAATRPMDDAVKAASTRYNEIQVNLRSNKPRVKSSHSEGHNMLPATCGASSSSSPSKELKQRISEGKPYGDSLPPISIRYIVCDCMMAYVYDKPTLDFPCTCILFFLLFYIKSKTLGPLYV